MLSLNNLIKRYKTKGSADIKALNGISLDFPDTGMVFILGKSGSGKSTLLNVAGGLDIPDNGEIILNGRSSKDFKPTDFDAYRNTYVGFIFQEYNILSEFNVEQNIALAMQLQGSKSTSIEVERVLKLVGLDGMGKRKPNTLSGGQKQRVAIARALIKDPSIIMADEPTGALDSETGREVLDTLHKLSADRLVLVVTHDREFAETYGDRIIELKDGKVIADTGSRTAELTENKRKRELIKSGLPISKAAKMGACGLTRHKVRLIMMALISIISFTMFGTVSTLMTYDARNTVASAIAASDYSAALMAKNSWYDSDVIFFDSLNGKEEKFKEQGTLPALFGKNEITELNENVSKAGLSFAGIFITKKMENDKLRPILQENFDYNVGSDSSANSTKTVADYYSSQINWFSDCGEDYLRRNFGDDCLIAGRYPVTSEEIAISEYHYRIFEKYGYTTNNNSQIVITSPLDLINKTLNLSYLNKTFTITGIYHVGNIDEKYNTLKEFKNLTGDALTEREELKANFAKFMENSFHTTAYVSDAFYEKYGSTTDKADPIEFTAGSSNLDLRMNTMASKAENNYIYGSTDILSYEGLSEISGLKIYNYGEYASSELAENQCLIMVSQFVRMAEQLRASIKINETLTYGETHAEFNDAYARLKRATEYKTYDIPNEADIKVVYEAMRNDWNDYVLVNKNSYESYNKFYLGDEHLPVEIAGVVYSEERSEANTEYAYILHMDFIKSNATTVKYRQEIKTTNYNAPSDERYAYAITPTTNAYSETHYLLNMAARQTDFDFSYKWENGLYEEAQRFGDVFDIYGLPFMIVGLVLGVFAALLLFNFISASVADRQKEIGILRALGARSRDVFKIFFTESAIVASICFVVSSALSAIACVIIDSMLRKTLMKFSILNFSFLNVLMIFGIALCVAFIGTIIPVWLAARKSPVESIRKN